MLFSFKTMGQTFSFYVCYTVNSLFSKTQNGEMSWTVGFATFCTASLIMSANNKKQSQTEATGFYHFKWTNIKNWGTWQCFQFSREEKSGVFVWRCFVSVLMHDITLASSAPARSLASRLQLDLAERNDGGEQSHYGESFLLSNAFVWHF